MLRITDAVQRHAQERPGHLACADAVSTCTWADLHRGISDWEGRLAALGVRVGDRVALCLPDGVQALHVLLAVLRLGAVHAPIDHTLAAPEIAAASDVLAATWLIDLDQAGQVRISATGQARQQDPLAEGSSAFLRLTSGTTGMSKGVLLSHATLRERVQAANRGLCLTAEDRVLWLLPMAYHVAVSVLLYIDVGAAIIFGNRLRASATARVAHDHACTFAYASPWHVRRLADLEAGALPTSLRRVVSTTTALDSDTGLRMWQRHGIPIQQALGIIECGLPLLSPGDPGEAVGSFAAVPGFSLSIHAADRDGVGELWVAGPGLLDAYLDPWRTRSEILHEGRWFGTGDLARIDSAGTVHLLGRMKDVINVGGVKVFPQEVESVLAAHADVVAVRVHAEADPRTGEHVCAEVQVRSPDQGDAIITSLQRWCAERLAVLKQPAHIRIVAALDMTPSGKVRR